MPSTHINLFPFAVFHRGHGMMGFAAPLTTVLGLQQPWSIPNPNPTPRHVLDPLVVVIVGLTIQHRLQFTRRFWILAAFYPAILSSSTLSSSTLSSSAALFCYLC